MSCLMTKPTKWHVHPVKTPISLGIRPVWSESLLPAWRKLRSLANHWVHNEDTDQTAQADLSLLGTQSFGWFCHEVAQITSDQKAIVKACMIYGPLAMNIYCYSCETLLRNGQDVCIQIWLFAPNSEHFTFYTKSSHFQTCGLNISKQIFLT